MKMHYEELRKIVSEHIDDVLIIAGKHVCLPNWFDRDWFEEVFRQKHGRAPTEQEWEDFRDSSYLSDKVAEEAIEFVETMVD